MIEEKDIDVLFKAKKDRLAINILMALSSLFLCLIIFIEIIEYSREYTILLATISVVLMASSIGVNKWVSVSRDQLIQTIENIVNKDPDALEMIAKKKNAE